MRLTAATLLFAAVTCHAADVDVDALLARLARPAPDTVAFVEVRYSALLAEPLVASGELEHRADGALVRRVLDPYRETTLLQGEQVRVSREGGRTRSFALDRAPELRGMLAGFGAILLGDRAVLDRHFALVVRGDPQAWRIEMVPRDERLQRRLSGIVVDGTEDRARCFTMLEPDGDASVMVLGAAGRSGLPPALGREALGDWCGGEGEP